MTVFQRLLKYPHAAVFDKSPAAELALRVRHADGFVWGVADEILTVTIGGDTTTYNLATLTVGQLSAALQTAGCDVDALSPTFAGLSASVLIEGAGDQDQSNGDQLKGFTSLLWSLFGGYARELREARRQVGEALRQMVITQAEGEWLDLWGTLYDQRRKDGEADEDFAPRIPKEAFRIRVNGLAIEKAIFDATGKDVRIEEPWGSMFRLDESQLSGTSRFYDGGTVGYHLIRPVSYEPIRWDDVLAVIERNRAAGVVVLPPETRIRSLVNATVDGTIWTAHSALISAVIPAWADNRLDYMVLSAEEIARNFSCTTEDRTYNATINTPISVYAISREMTGYTWLEMGQWTDLPWSIGGLEFEALIDAIDHAEQYANNELYGDMT